MFHAVFERQARRTFELVNQHDYDSVLASATPDIHHRFSGDHALAGDRHDAVHLRLWFERLHRLMPGLTLTVTDVWVAGQSRIVNGNLAAGNEIELINLAALWQNQICPRNT